MESTFSHFGVCVSNLERSVALYGEALGFEKGESHSIGREFASLMDLEDVTLASQFMRKGTTTIELLEFEDPAPYGDRVRRALNQLGITHFSFRVNDVAAAAAKVVECGGTVVETSRTTLGSLEFVYCTDPDGVRIELMDLGS
jgi:catechol 2,3-dioxygenase-like lactoylglutathione lyase family enzyme